METGSEIFETEEGSAQNDTDNRVEKVNDPTEENENITDRIEKVDDASMEQQKIEKPRHSVSIDNDVSDKSKKKKKIADAKGEKADDTCAKQETEKQKHLDQDVSDKSKKKKNIKKKPADESSEDEDVSDKSKKKNIKKKPVDKSSEDEDVSDKLKKKMNINKKNLDDSSKDSDSVGDEDDLKPERKVEKLFLKVFFKLHSPFLFRDFQIFYPNFFFLIHNLFFTFGVLLLP